jgi:hypothetical protein
MIRSGEFAIRGRPGYQRIYRPFGGIISREICGNVGLEMGRQAGWGRIRDGADKIFKGPCGGLYLNRANGGGADGLERTSMGYYLLLFLMSFLFTCFCIHPFCTIVRTSQLMGYLHYRSM